MLGRGEVVLVIAGTTGGVTFSPGESNANERVEVVRGAEISGSLYCVLGEGVGCDVGLGEQ